MTRGRDSVIATALLLAAAARAQPPWPVALQSKVVEEARAFDGEIALYVKDLPSGVRYTHNAATPAYLASGVKIFVMVAVFQEQHDGHLRWDERLPFEEEDQRDGAPVMAAEDFGSRHAVAKLLGHMMHHSDNAATDMLVRRVGIETVNRVARRYAGPGVGHITSLIDVRRLVYEDIDPAAQQLSPFNILTIRSTEGLGARAQMLGAMLGRDGPVTAAQLKAAYRRYYEAGYNSAPLDEVGALLEGLARGQVVSPEASQQMLEIMLGCRTGKRRLVAGLPAGAWLAHKTGTQLGRVCDLGVVFPPEGGAFVLAACLKGYASTRKAEAVLARLATQSYDALHRSAARSAPAPKVAAKAQRDAARPDGKIQVTITEEP